MLNRLERIQLLTPLMLALALVCVCPFNATAATFEFEWDPRSPTASARLRDVPIRQVLEHLQIRTGWEVMVEPGLDLTVSTTFHDLKQGRALAEVLGTANFALIQSDTGPARLLVFKSDRHSATEAVLVTNAEGEESDRLIPNELIVTLSSREEAERIAEELGAEIVGSIDELGTYRLRFKDEASAKAARAALEDRDDVQAVDSNYEIRRPYESMPLTGTSLPIPAIRQGGEAGDTLVIGLVDTALQVPEGALGEFFLQPINIAAGSADTSSKVPTHATSMANDILFQMTELVGAGNTVNAKILSVDVFGSQGDTSTFQLGQGLVEAWNHGSTLINASLGSKAPSPWLDAIIHHLTAEGAVILAPSGNVPDGLPTYPAANPAVIGITATGPDGNIAPYANFAPFVDAALPGDSIVTLTGDAYYVRGTSSATAKATGAVAGYVLSTGGTVQDGSQFVIEARGVQRLDPTTP